MWKVSSIIPGLRDISISKHQVGGHHQVKRTSSKDIRLNLQQQSGGQEKQTLLPLKGKPGGGAQNPPGRCWSCNCIIGRQKHGSRCRAK